MSDSKKVLAIDLGLKRTGMAISDELGLTARLLDNLEANSRQQAINKISQLVKDENIAVIVIGLPEALTDHSKAVAKRAHGLSELLKKHLDQEGISARIVLMDESYTSRRASLQLAQSGVKKKHRKAKLDSASAAVLLQDYLMMVSHEDE